MSKITIRDVARTAGVSLATVDRVLNHRPGVRSITVERVEGAIRSLNYQPDRIAARLARSRNYRFCVILPSGTNSFMEGLAGEIAEAARRYRQERVHVELVRTDVFDGDAFARVLEQLDDDFDGVATVALDHPAVREAINGLAARGIAVVTLVSDLPGSRRIHYVGVDNRAAGRTAGSLLGRFVGARKGKVALIAGSLSLRDHVERQSGFEQVLAEDFPQLKVLPVREGRDDWQRVQRVTATLLAEHRDLAAIYNVGAGNRGIIAALEASGRAGKVVLVAHELTEHTRKALIRGSVDAVINQDAGHEARSAIRVLMAHADGAPIVEAQERIRIDIFLRDNLP